MLRLKWYVCALDTPEAASESAWLEVGLVEEDGGVVVEGLCWEFDS